MGITKIIIKSSSGYCSAEYAYTDKLIITQESLQYEYFPYLEFEEQNKHQKWSYKTNSPLYKDWYERVAEMTPEYLNNDEDLFFTDIGPTEITAIFDDMHKQTESFFCPSKYFEKYFSLITEMIPAGENIPELLKIGDYE